MAYRVLGFLVDPAALAAAFATPDASGWFDAVFEQLFAPAPVVPRETDDEKELQQLNDELAADFVQDRADHARMMSALLQGGAACRERYWEDCLAVLCAHVGERLPGEALDAVSDDYLGAIEKTLHKRSSAPRHFLRDLLRDPRAPLPLPPRTDRDKDIGGFGIVFVDPARARELAAAMANLDPARLDPDCQDAALQLADWIRRAAADPRRVLVLYT